MKTRGHKQLRDYFLARTSDLTPNGARRNSSVLYAPFSDAKEVFELCTAVLTCNERQRMARLVGDSLRSAFAQRRAFQRFCAATAVGDGLNLSKIVFDVTDKGQSFLQDAPDLRFSFSSCRSGMLGAWSANCAVGVDIEDDPGDTGVLALAREYFTADEADVVEQAASADRGTVFYQLWSLKEAALKSIGEGMPFGLDKFAFEVLPGPRVIDAPVEFGGPRRFHAYTVGQGSLNAALVTRMPPASLV